MCISLQRRAIQNVKMRVSLQRRTQKCKSPAAYKNHRFTTVSNVRPARMTKGFPVQLKNLRFTTVLDVRRARSDERVARAPSKFAFHHSFGRPTITFCVKGRSATWKICISPQFWASDEHELTRRLLRQSRKIAFHHSFGRPTSTKWREGCFGNLENLHFTTVLGVRQARSDERVVSRRDLPNLPCGKKRRNFIKEEQPLSAALLSSSSQQLFSAAFLSSCAQQLFSAALLSSFSQQLFSAALLSSLSQQLFSAAFLSSSSQQPFSAALLSSSSQQLEPAAWTSSSSQQLFSATFSQQSSCCGQGLVVS